MKFLIVLIIFCGCSSGKRVHSKHAEISAMSREDIHKELLKLKCELTRNKEELRAFKGKLNSHIVYD